MLVQVGFLIFSVDFIILNFEYVGHMFLVVGRSMSDVATGQLTMKAHDKDEMFCLLRLEIIFCT